MESTLESQSKESTDNLPTTSTPKIPTSNQNRRIFTLGFVGFIGVVLIVAIVVGIVRMYNNLAQDRFSLTIAKVLQLPAAKINGEPILYTNYVDDLQAIRTMRAYTASHGGGQEASLTDEQMSDQVLLRLANNVLLSEAAAKFKVTVSKEDLDGLTSQVVQQFKTTTDVDNELKVRYGWNLTTYQDKVMRPFLLQNKLSQQIQADPTGRETVRARAEEVLSKLKSGADFATLAKQYGEDGTAAEGGDLGFFGKGEMVPQFETAAFALKKGQVTQTLVESPYGYHIIKLTDRKTETSKDTTGKNVKVEKVRASHILLMFPSAPKYLDKALAEAVIHLYIKAHNPFLNLKK